LKRFKQKLSFLNIKIRVFVMQLSLKKRKRQCGKPLKNYLFDRDDPNTVIIFSPQAKFNKRVKKRLKLRLRNNKMRLVNKKKSFKGRFRRLRNNGKSRKGKLRDLYPKTARERRAKTRTSRKSAASS